MSCWRKDILTITSSTETINFSLWVSLMNVFEKHVDELDLEDVEIIVDKVEEYRIYLNQHSCSHIEQHEVNPNVYQYLENMKKEKNNKTEWIQSYQNQCFVDA